MMHLNIVTFDIGVTRFGKTKFVYNNKIGIFSYKVLEKSILNQNTIINVDLFL